MAETDLTINFGDADGEQSFASWEELESWISKERARWDWLDPATPNLDVNSIAQHVRNTFHSINNDIVNSRNAGHPPAQLSGLLNNAYHPISGYLRRSDGKDGTLASDARLAAGDEAGAFAYAIATGKASIPQATTIAHFRGAMMVAMPGMDQPTDIAQRLSNERANYKASQRSSIRRLENVLNEQRDEFGGLVGRFKALGRKALEQRRRRWKEQQSTWAQQALSAVADIRATDESYKVAMGLRAPVEYWRAKAGEHRQAENGARKRLYWFFPGALILLIGSFAGAAALLLFSDAASIPSTIYVIISGGLLSITAVAFWVGRLLTKLYLSEHHLRHDAEERAVMTTTYLALTNEKGADEGDRHIILTSLFRPTTDGLVKEEGPVDLSLAAILARLGTK